MTRGVRYGTDRDRLSWSAAESYLIDLTADQFSEIIKHIGEGPTRLNQSPSPSVDDYHNVSRVQYVVHMEGASEVEVADGTVRRLNPGDVLVARDTTGHGHITRGIGRGIQVCLNVPLVDGPWMPKR